MEQDKFTFVKNTFQQIYQAVEKLSDAEITDAAADPFRTHLDRLNQVAALDVDEDVLQRLVEDVELGQMIGRIAHVKRLHSTRLETSQARGIIDSVDPWKSLNNFFYYPNYLELARMECTGAKLNLGENIVFIGSGPLPLSLILLCRLYDVNAIGIEINPQFVSISRELIDRLGLVDRIRIIEGNHFSFPQDNKCKLVMIGAEALPKDEIFNHLANILPGNTIVSYRIFARGLRRLLDDQSRVIVPSVFREFMRVQPEPPVNNTVVFLIKEQ